jgi:hypothetical protein
MGRLLTDEEWRVQTPPMEVTQIKYESWTDTHFEIAEKWIIDNSEGWVYFKRQDRFCIFGLASDATLFDLWLEEGILDRERGSIKAKEKP